MDTNKMKTILGPTIEKIEERKRESFCSSFSTLAELLIDWYNRQFQTNHNVLIPKREGVNKDGNKDNSQRV